MDTLKKRLPLIAVLLAALSAVMLVLVIALPAVHVPPSASFSNDDGLRAGWNVIFYGPGLQIRYGAHEFGANVTLILATVIPILATVILGPMWHKAGAVKRRVICAVLAVLDLFAAVCLFNLCAIALTTAATPTTTSDAISMYSAINASPELYYPTALTTAAAVICLLSAAALIAGFVLVRRERPAR